MSHESLEYPPIDLNAPAAPHPRTVNRRTPSRRWNINRLPPELIRIIFWYYCSTEYGPVPLLFVCRSWHAIASGYPALWAFITFERGKKSKPAPKTIGGPVLCQDWPQVKRALKCAGTYTISLALQLNGCVYIADDRERVSSLLSRCRDLHITSRNVAMYAFRSGFTMPHLEALSLDITETIRIEPLLDQIESGSPRMKSLSICGLFPTHLAQLPSLLKRLIHLELRSIPREFTDDSKSQFKSLQQLEVLILDYHQRIKIPSLTLPKLVSLEIRNVPLQVGSQQQFPALESLTLVGSWSNLPLISAPKLRRLVLRYAGTSAEVAISTLRQATVRPLSLFTDFISEIHFPELLEMWSSLAELHLRGKYNVCIPGPKTTAALAGCDLAGPLCPSLRYLTTHIEQDTKNHNVTNESIRRLQMIVEGRKSHGIRSLQRVTCVWDYDKVYENFRDGTGSKDVEWVDII